MLPIRVTARERDAIRAAIADRAAAGFLQGRREGARLVNRHRDFDVRHGDAEELLEDAECALADLTRALGPLADLVEDMSGRRVIQPREAVFHPTRTPREVEIVR